MPTWYQGFERHIDRAADRVIEALLPPLIRIYRQQRIIMTLVSVDDSLLTSISSLLDTVDTEVKSLVAEHNIPDGTPQVQAISDKLAQVQADLTASTSTPPADTGTGDQTPPADTPPADGGDVNPTP